ncbi:MAG: nucleotidyltransferase domain-containing protein [Brevundimonas sp.]|nr:MAG: nucleotidyltransferase domain-containing protein [Brevundimonas sp.]
MSAAMDRSSGLLEKVLTVLRAHAEGARAAGVAFIGVVGSVARGEETTESDVDVVFDAGDDLDYWKLSGLVADIEDDLGRRVDVVDRAMMRPENWAFMSRDLVLL